MGWVAPVLGVASALFGASQQKKAAQAQSQSNQQAIDYQKYMFDQMRGDLQPFMQGGLQGLAALTGNKYEQSPGYQYLKDEMISGVDASAAARGQLYSGGHGLDMARHINGLAAQDYGNWWNRNLGLAQLGQSSAAGVGAAGLSTANNVGGYLQNQGNAAASGYGAMAGAGYGIGNILGNVFAPKPQSSYVPPQSNGNAWAGY